MEKTGTEILESMNLGPDHDVLKYKVANIKRRLAAVTESCVQRKDTLHSIQPLVEQHHEIMRAFLLFLDAIEDKLEYVKGMPTDQESAANRSAEMTVNVHFSDLY